ncbi:MAG: hypothetical protein ACXAES_15825 [Promethearchaeota archaeon]
MDENLFKHIFKYSCEQCGRLYLVPVSECMSCGANAIKAATTQDYNQANVQIMIALLQQEANWKEKFALQRNAFMQIIHARTKIMRMFDKQEQILHDLSKNEEEYKTLLKKKKLGEPVEDQITDNRYYRQLLTQEDKENLEKLIVILESEEGKELFAMIDHLKRQKYIKEIERQNR